MPDSWQESSSFVTLMTNGVGRGTFDYRESSGVVGNDSWTFRDGPSIDDDPVTGGWPTSGIVWIRADPASGMVTTFSNALGHSFSTFPTTNTLANDYSIRIFPSTDDPLNVDEATYDIISYFYDSTNSDFLVQIDTYSARNIVDSPGVNDGYVFSFTVPDPNAAPLDPVRWIAERVGTGPWQVSRFGQGEAGAAGSDGPRGAGRWNVRVSSIETNPTQATLTGYLRTVLNDNTADPIVGDQLWLFTSVSATDLIPTDQDAWLYTDESGTAQWTRQDEVIRGNLIVGGTITASEIASQTITAAELAADSVTATQINVDNLAAVSATLGDVNIDAARINSGTIDNARINGATITSLDADNINAGTLNADRIQIDGATLDTDVNGNLTVQTTNGGGIVVGGDGLGVNLSLIHI